MSTEMESKLSAAIELTQWVTSILAAATYRFVKDTIVSNVVLLVATSLACLLGTFIYYKKVISVVPDVKESVSSSVIPEIMTVATTKIDSTPIAVTQTTKPADNADFYPCINLVPTYDVESDNDGSEEDDKEDFNEKGYTNQYSTHINNVVSDSDGYGSNNDEEDEEDWNEEDYNQRFPPSKPSGASTRSAPKKENSTTTSTTNTSRASKPASSAAKKKETLSQMRKRVAREMKESEERRKKQAAAGAAPKAARSALPTKKSIRKESVAAMKARVAREFAAKLKN